MKRSIFIGGWLLAGLLSLQAQGQEAGTAFSYRVEPTGNWVYYSPARPRIEVGVCNRDNRPANASLRLEVFTDQYRPCSELSQSVRLAAGDSTGIEFAFSVPEPGFYRCVLSESGREVKRFNIGYEPASIVSLPDAPSDLKAFWDRARAELAQVAPDYQLTHLPDGSNKTRNLYLVRMKSLGGAEISGYYSVPVKPGKYPAFISYMGYGSKPWIPGGAADRTEFVLSVRGQGLQEPVNTYGDWITYGLDSPENYYYRGAFMDLIRAIDFVASRAETDASRIFAEGGSQGGAFSMVAAALDQRLCAIAPTIPFLSDYPDYFRIVRWPADPVLKRQKELGISDADLYRLLSYFDVKNLAAWITCPVIMGVGLQDEVCPPHTNFAGYNRVRTEKEYYIYPTNGHNTPSDWWVVRTAFFDRYLRKPGKKDDDNRADFRLRAKK